MCRCVGDRGCDTSFRPPTSIGLAYPIIITTMITMAINDYHHHQNHHQLAEGQLRTMEAELALTTSLLRRALSVVGVKAQARLLLGRLETIGPGAAAAAGRRNNALNLERIWANKRRADLLSRAQGKTLLRRGQLRRD